MDPPGGLERNRMTAGRLGGGDTSWTIRGAGSGSALRHSQRKASGKIDPPC